MFSLLFLNIFQFRKLALIINFLNRRMKDSATGSKASRFFKNVWCSVSLSQTHRLYNFPGCNIYPFRNGITQRHGSINITHRHAINSCSAGVNATTLFIPF